MRTTVFELPASHYSHKDGEETFVKLHNLLEIRSQNDNKLHVKDVGKRSDIYEKILFSRS